MDTDPGREALSLPSDPIIRGDTVRAGHLFGNVQAGGDSVAKACIDDETRRSVGGGASLDRGSFGRRRGYVPRMAVLPGRSGAPPLLEPGPDHGGERVAPRGGLGLPERGRGRDPVQPHCRGRVAVRGLAGPAHLRVERRHGQGGVDLRAAARNGHPVRPAGRAVLGIGRRPADHRRHGASRLCPRRRHRRLRRGFRRGRVPRPQGLLRPRRDRPVRDEHVAGRHLPRHADRVGARVRGAPGRPGRHHGLRPAHGRAALGVPHHSATRRVRVRHLASRGLEDRRRRQLLGRHDPRRGPRHRLRPHGVPGLRFLRRRPGRHEPFLELPHRPQGRHGRAGLALSDGPPRPVGPRPAVAAQPGDRRARREETRRRGPDHQVGLRLPLRPRHGGTPLPHRRTTGSRVGHPRRGRLAHPARAAPAAAFRPPVVPGRAGDRSDARGPGAGDRTAAADAQEQSFRAAEPRRHAHLPGLRRRGRMGRRGGQSEYGDALRQRQRDAVDPHPLRHRGLGGPRRVRGEEHLFPELRLLPRRGSAGRRPGNLSAPARPHVQVHPRPARRHRAPGEGAHARLRPPQTRGARGRGEVHGGSRSHDVGSATRRRGPRPGRGLDGAPVRFDRLPSVRRPRRIPRDQAALGHPHGHRPQPGRDRLAGALGRDV